MEVHNNSSEPWKVTLLDTGLNTMTGGRILRAKSYINDQPFMLTYGDGLADVDISKLIGFHQSHGKFITMTSVQPEGRFGAMALDSKDRIKLFTEKPKGDGSWINGGFFVCEPNVMDYIDNDSTIFERQPLEQLAHDGQLYAYKHDGFWKCMDTLRDKTHLNELWSTSSPKWKVWN
jgi:glucose-1-phosphate cytidylyltransferase